MLDTWNSRKLWKTKFYLIKTKTKNAYTVVWYGYSYGFENEVFPDLFYIFCSLELNASLSNLFSDGSYLSQSDNTSSFLTPTYVI